MGRQASTTYLIAMVTRLHGNCSDTSITPLSSLILSPYLVQRFAGTLYISLIPRCLGNLVVMATRVKHQ